MNNLLRSCFWTCGRGSYEPCRRLHAEVGEKKDFENSLASSTFPPRLVSFLAGNRDAFIHYGSLPFWTLPFLLPYLGWPYCHS